MKKLSILLSFFICAILSFSQPSPYPPGPAPIKQAQASASTLLKNNGLGKDSLGRILSMWPDTTTANLHPFLKFYPAVEIVINDTVWMRNSTATAWIKTGGGGAADSSFVSLTVGNNYSQIGTRFNHNWANAISPDFTDNTPSATVTVAGGKTNITGGAFNLNNNLSWNSGYISTHSWRFTQTIVINEKSGTSFGIGFRLAPAAAGSYFFAHFLLADTTGYVAFTTNNSLPNSGSKNNRSGTSFRWSTGDTVDLVMVRQNRTITISMQNRNGGTPSSLTIPVAFTAGASLAIFTYGGDYDFINNFLVTYTDIRRPRWGTMGMSITYGAFSYTEGTDWTSQTFDGAAGGWSDFSASSTASLDGSLIIGDITTYSAPEYLVIDYVPNDRNGGVPLATFSAQMTAIITTCLNASPQTIPILITGVPQSTGSVVTYNDTVYALAARYGLRVIPAYEALVANSGTAMDVKFNSGDGIHPNQFGQTQIGGVARETLNDLITLSSPLNLKGIPVSYQQYYNLGVDQAGNLIKWYRKGDTSYIINVDTLSPETIKPGNININGGIWSETVVAGGNQQNGGAARLDNTGLVAIAGHFKATMTVGATLSNANRFDVQTGSVVLATKTFDVFNGSRFTSNSQPFTIDRILPQSGTQYGVQIRASTSGGGMIQSGYRHINIENPSGTTVAWMDRAGGWHVDSVSGYNSNINGLLGVNSWITKGYVDSLFATGGGTTLYTGNGSLLSERTVDMNGFGLTFIADAPGNGVTFDLNAAVGGFQASANTVELSGDSVALRGSDASKSNFLVKNDTILLRPFQGMMYIDTLVEVTDTTGYDIHAWNRTTGQWVRMPSTIIGAGGGGSLTGTVELDSILAAVAANTINSGAFQQEWQWNTLASGYGLLLSSTSTSAASNTQRLFGAVLSGANATSAQTTTAGYFSNTHTGTTSVNNAIQAVASGGASANYAILTGTSAANDGRINANFVTTLGNHTVGIRSVNNTADQGLIIYANNETQSVSYAYNGVRGSSNLTLSAAGSAHVLLQPGGGVGVGTGVSAPSAFLEISAGTTTRAPLEFNPGTNLTTPVNGTMEYNGTNLFFTRTGAVRESVITANAVNVVSPTAPNRTITVVIDGTTYYISAKTTND